VTSTTLDRNTDTSAAKRHYPDWKVVVLNDDVNSFEHVAICLVRIIPNTTPEVAWETAHHIHNTGSAVVWTGPLEQAEMYHEQLRAKGLTLAPLETD
jgi:ATP-dependent Clp protease adaptor protein ClpS